MSNAPTSDPQSVIVAAEQAAAAGDYASAEQLLREAARLQEAAQGPLHPDLANTLNNLGIVCEIADKPTDAERFFRRAHAIATATLEANHPFVATSRKNLEDFCTARGIAVDVPSASSIAARAITARPGSEAVQSERVLPEESGPVAPGAWPRPVAIGGLIAGGVVLALIATTTWFRSNETTPSLQTTERAQPPRRASTPAEPPAVPIAAAAPTPSPTNKGDAPAASPVSQPVVVTAQLCKELVTGVTISPPNTWRCVPPSNPVPFGPLIFYTRLKSPTATTVQHRWYRDDRLRRVVDLRIDANATDGYRTYSRQTVSNNGTGEWRVELRTTDGVLLHEERFVVR
jgi:Protein of unknown function (DUF2914)/Tetratricopeptide repeat